MNITAIKIEQKRANYFKPVFWTVLFLMSLSVLVLYDIPLARLKSAHAHYMSIRWMLIPHIIGGLLALLIGPFQFSTRIRQRSLKFHRVLGRVYVYSVFLAAPLGMAIALYLRLSGIFIVANLVQSGSWFVTTLAAFLTARNRHIVQHRQWMIRSYSVTFTFILMRVFNPLPFWVHVRGKPFGVTQIVVTFLAVFIPDIAFNLKEMTSRRT